MATFSPNTKLTDCVATGGTPQYDKQGFYVGCLWLEPGVDNKKPQGSCAKGVYY